MVMEVHVAIGTIHDAALAPFLVLALAGLPLARTLSLNLSLSHPSYNPNRKPFRVRFLTG